MVLRQFGGIAHIDVEIHFDVVVPKHKWRQRRWRMETGEAQMKSDCATRCGGRSLELRLNGCAQVRLEETV